MHRLILIPVLVLFAIVNQAQTPAEYYTKGNDLKKDKKITEAVAAYKEAVRLDPAYKEAWYELGWCYNDLKQYSNALSSLSKARSLQFSLPKMYFELGYAFEKLEKTDSAIANYNKCLSIKPDYSGAFLQLGYIAYNKDENAAALQYFKQYELYAPAPSQSYLYWYRKGFVCNALKNFEDAKIALNKSLALKQDYMNTYFELGFAHSRLKQNDEAIAQYKKGIELDPRNHIGYNGIAEVYRDNIKDREEAMNWYRKTLAINPNERKANFGVGYCLNSAENYSEAVGYLKKAIEQESTYTAAYVELGYANYRLSNNSLALENLKKALELSPQNENARYYAGLVYISQGNKDAAQKMATELRNMNSSNASSLQEKVNKM